MAGPRMNRTLKIILVVVACVAALGIAAAAVIAGVVESERSAATRTTGPTPQPTAVAFLQVVPPTAAGTATVRPAPAPSSAPSLPLPEPTAYAPEVIETVQAAVPPGQQRPQQQQQTVCPSGVVESGLTDITVTNERYTTVAGVSTMADILGHGLIRNRTTAPVYIFNSAPSVKGLDVNGRVTTYLDTDFDWKPTPGEPRPAQITLQPGQDLAYAVHRSEISTETLRTTAAWHVNPEDSVDYYADFRTYVDCPHVSVAALPGGTSIMNTYVPWGQ